MRESIESHPFETSGSRRWGRVALSGLALALMMTWTGCQSSRPKALDEARTLFEMGDYEDSLRVAEASHLRTAGAYKEEAAFIAGMSEYELKRYDNAKAWLRPLVRSSDKDISGRASATLGLVAAAQGQYTTAALDLMSAGRKLTGDEGARALLMAGDCYRLLGRLDAANLAYSTGRGMAQSAKLKETLASRLENSAYTVQFGAFSSYANATRALDGARSRAAAQGLPTPAIVSSSDVTGQSLYLVQSGRYDTKEKAAAARVRLGGDVVVVPVELE